MELIETEDLKKIKEKTLFLWIDNQAFLAEEAKKRGIQAESIMKDHSSIIQVVRKIHTKLKFPFQSIWYKPWKKALDYYDTVIIHDAYYTIETARYIKQVNPNIRVIIWYWNPVNKSVPVEMFQKLECEIWSFDEADCQRYNLNYNTQYYSTGLIAKNKTIKTDIFFVGADKGRLTTILELERKMKQLNITTNFHVTEGGKLSNNNYDYKERLSYEEIVENISQSKCVLDFVSDGQTGLTLRPLEALFFSKKLITNDKSIKERNFYHQNNIFILGIDDIEQLPSFIESDYFEIDRSILLSYDLEQWFSRFF